MVRSIIQTALVAVFAVITAGTCQNTLVEAATLGVGVMIPPQPTQYPAQLSFERDIKPLADSHCKECHGEIMSDYANIASKKYITPGSPDQSRYYTKPTGKASHGGESAWRDKADTIRNWIETGAAG